MTIHSSLGPKLKHRRRGVIGPENFKTALVFVDDLNMPKKEIFGAQPVLELMRQWFDHGGWYDMIEFEFKTVADIFFLSAMGLPGGGRSVISSRLVRHFNLMNYTNMSKDSICNIFKSILNGFYKDYEDYVKESIDSIVKTTE